LGSINILQMGRLEYKKTISEEEYKNYLEKNSEIISFMSETMQTFQNFYQPNQMSQFFDVKNAVDVAINIVKATFNYNDISLDLKSDENLPSILGNQNEYSQIILSILNNAKNIFIQRKVHNPKVLISINNIDNNIVLTITDNGGGIINKEINDIFSPFISSRKSTGMGLYLVKSICQKNSWNIEAVNENDGAKFILSNSKENIGE